MFYFIKEISWFIKKYWYMYLGIIILGLSTSFLLLVPTMIIGDFIAHIRLNSLTNNYLFINIVLFLVLTAIGLYIVTTSKKIIEARLNMRLYYELQVQYLEKILSQDALFFSTFQAGDLLTRALGDIRSVRLSGVRRIINIILETATIIIVLGKMLTINWSLTLICIIPLPFIFLFNLFFKKIIKKNWKKVRSASSDMGNVILESITNVRTIRAFTKEEENCAKLINSSNRVYQIERKNVKVNSLFMPIFLSIVTISTTLAYWFGTELILADNNFEVDHLIMMTLYLNMFSFPLMRIGNMINNFYESFISFDRLNEICNSNTTIIDKPDCAILEAINNVEFKNISFTYDEHNYILRNIDFKLKKGETLGIVGKTGSGKTSLIQLLIRLYPIEYGQILLNDIDINNYAKSDIRSHIAYVPQEHLLFSKTIKANVSFGSVKEISNADFNEIIMLSDFQKDLEYLPDGLQTIVGEYGVTLSGGQKQRLAIARALIKDADILIMDDSLSAVDGKTEANIISNLKKIRSNKTNIIISHRLSAIKGANQIIVLDKGKIIEQGTHHELMNLGGWYYRQYLEQQLKEGEKNV